MSRKGVSSKPIPRRRAVGSTALAREAMGQSAISHAMTGLARRYPKTLRLCITIAKKNPVESKIAGGAGIATATLRYWLKLSERGNPGDDFDLETDHGRVERFHILFQDAVAEGVGEVEHKVFMAATGQEKEILSHQGRVSYRYDLDLLRLGMTGEAAYLLDKFGDPVPETIPLLDLETARWFLSRRKPEMYGNRQTVQVDHKHSGVLVVAPGKTSKELEERYADMRHDTIQDVEFEEVEGDTPALTIEIEGGAS